jgi:hypothetical protein
LEEAQNLLKAFLPRFNRRFSVPPSVPGLAYRPIPPRMKLEEVFCFKYYRTVEADNVGALGDHRIQINPCHGRQSYNRARVEIQERMEGSLAVYYQGKCLITQPAPAEAPVLRVQKRGRLGSRESSASSELPTTKEKTPSPQKATSPYKPGPDHPWRKLWKRKTQRTDIFTGQLT